MTPPPCRIYLHPTLLARRAAEIARGQGATRIEWDARGRPFLRGADPLAESPAAAEPPHEPMRFAWLIRLIHSLAPTAPLSGPLHRRRVPR